ncbi:MAG: glycogen debranching protein GlgX [Planctomycetota bacterium]|nr:glycogen debranching protein GlgX [Planctomycetota bacterium]
MLMKQANQIMQFTHVLPYGALLHDNGVQFVVFSRNATRMRVLLYDEVDQSEPVDVIEFDSERDRWGDIWSIFVPGIRHGQLYHFQADGPFEPDRGHRFDGTARLIDPYAKALAGTFQDSSDGITRPPKCVVIDDFFEWEGDRHLRVPLADTVIYEMHVRGFTKHESSQANQAGSYLGVIEKIPYLKSLGVTAVELMPVHEFPILNFDGSSGGPRNYWGYDSMAFFSPHRGYAQNSEPGAQVNEFKQMVLELHKAGIEVILDVVFNHTCEGNERGPTLSFKGLENSVYYMLESGGKFYKNYSGCGNTVNGNHPVTREMIFHCLRSWVHNYHIDGFRFDLASILSRDRNGELVPNPPLIEAIGEDPLLADTKIIAEAWDAAGAYQVGTFGDLRWAEWNGRYRDDVRRFWRGDQGQLGNFATRLAGSSDLYHSRRPYSSINFITSHDGFTLHDLVSYNEKHNYDNGENNRDGDNNNFSENHGFEGPTNDTSINEVRQRQIRNLFTTLLLSQGVPMLVSGDEVARTQGGNNNAYCQDNAISWFNWDLVEKNQGLFRFVQQLIAFRSKEPTVRRRRFLTGEVNDENGLPDVSWYSAFGTAVDWEGTDSALVCLLAANAARKFDKQSHARDVLILFNANSESHEFLVPPAAKLLDWGLFVDTAADSPEDIFPEPQPVSLASLEKQVLMPKSTKVFVSLS